MNVVSARSQNPGSYPVSSSTEFQWELRMVSVKEDKFVGKWKSPRSQVTETTVTERQLTHHDD